MSFAYLHESFPDPTKTFVYREVAAMDALGMEPQVFSIRTPSAEEQVMQEALPVKVRTLPEEAALREMIERERASFSTGQRRELSHWRGQKGDSTRVFEALWLGRELRRLGVRHVHAHFAGMAARTAWLVRRLWGIGFSFTGHADDIFSPEEKPISLAMLVADARFIATETDYSRERLERDFAAARGKTFRVFNGLGAESFAPVDAAPAEPPRIVSVGRLVEKKGFPDLLRACAVLKERGVRFGCGIVGGGPLEAELRAQIAQLGLGEIVTLHGPRPQREVRRLLAEARVFALAAQPEGDGGSDNLPTVIMEAMAAARPVVSTRLAGIPEMIASGETGTLTAPHDAPALAAALEVFLTNATLAAAYGERGQRVARERFAVEGSAAALAQLLTSHAPVTAPPAACARFPPAPAARLAALAGPLAIILFSSHSPAGALTMARRAPHAAVDYTSTTHFSHLMQLLTMTRRRSILCLIGAALANLMPAAVEAGDTFKWTVQYLIDNSQAVFGQSQKLAPRRNRGLALSPDGKFIFAGYHHGANDCGEIRKIAVGITDDFARATVRSLHGPAGKAIACDDKGRVYISNESDIVIYDANLEQLLHTIPVATSEGHTVTREGKDLVLYASDRQLGALMRWVVEEKGDGIAGVTPAGLDGSGQIQINGSLSLRGVDVDAKGNIWVADNEAGRVFRVSKDGKQIDSVEVASAVDIGIDGARAYVSRGHDRQVAVIETESLKLLGNLGIPWDELELTPTGNNRHGALGGIVVVPGKGFFVTNESGQTANQKSTYGRADEFADVIRGKLYRDAYNDDNDPILRALEVSE